MRRAPFLRLLMRAVFLPFRGQSIKGLYQKDPGETILALVVLAGVACVLVYVARIYYSYFYSRQFTRYPPSVAKYLRRALYFSNYAPDPKRALKNYRLALEQCDELHLDPFSDDVLGIRIQLASWLENVQNYDAAIQVLELLLRDCQKWVDLVEKGIASGDTTDSTFSSRLPDPMAGKAGKPEKIGDGDAVGEAEAAETESVWGRRSRLLRKAIGISIKLGELYADEHVLNTELAHERMVWSVDTALKEFQRRSTQGVKPAEGEWMSPKEMGAALESLGMSYESQSQFHLALPLFFQALRLCKDPCHSAVIMNNLAISFAQHQLLPPYDTLAGPVIDRQPGAPLPTYEDAQKAFLESAQRWALNAKQHAQDTKGAARTAECDEACAVALCNLGDIAALMGDVMEARRHFQQGRTMSEALNFAAGVAQAEAGLQRLPS